MVTSSAATHHVEKRNELTTAIEVRSRIYSSSRKGDSVSAAFGGLERVLRASRRIYFLEAPGIKSRKRKVLKGGETAGGSPPTPRMRLLKLVLDFSSQKGREVASFERAECPLPTHLRHLAPGRQTSDFDPRRQFKCPGSDRAGRGGYSGIGPSLGRRRRPSDRHRSSGRSPSR